MCSEIWYSNSDADVESCPHISCRLVNRYKLFEGSRFLHREGQGVEVLAETSKY